MANFTPEEISEILAEFFDVAGKRQYIGARYVPIFGRKDEDSIEWDNSAPYEPLTIVINDGNSYTSRTYVPAGVDIDDEAYWALTGNYNAQVELYRQEVVNISNIIPANDFSSVNTVKKYIGDSIIWAGNWIDVHDENELILAPAKAISENKAIRILRSFSTNQSIALESQTFLPYIDMCGNTITYSGSGTFITISGLSGRNIGGGIYNGRIVSQDIRDSNTCIEITNSCFLKFVDLEIRHFETAVKIINDGAGNFCEFNRFVRVWSAYCGAAFDLSIKNNGDTSMHGLELVNTYLDVPDNCLGVYIHAGVTVYDAFWTLGALGAGKLITCDGKFVNVDGAFLLETTSGHLLIDGTGLFNFLGPIRQEGSSYCFYPFEDGTQNNTFYSGNAPKFSCKNWQSKLIGGLNTEPIAGTSDVYAHPNAAYASEGLHYVYDGSEANPSKNMRATISGNDGIGDTTFFQIASTDRNSAASWLGFEMSASGRYIKFNRTGNKEIYINNSLVATITPNGIIPKLYVSGTISAHADHTSDVTITRGRYCHDSFSRAISGKIDVLNTINAWAYFATLSDNYNIGYDGYFLCYNSDTSTVSIKHLYFGASGISCETNLVANDHIIMNVYETTLV